MGDTLVIKRIAGSERVLCEWCDELIGRGMIVLAETGHMTILAYPQDVVDTYNHERKRWEPFVTTATIIEVA
jgi:hypothetical protein